MGILSHKGSQEMQLIVGHIIQDSVSEEQGKNGYLDRQVDVTDSESFPRVIQMMPHCQYWG